MLAAQGNQTPDQQILAAWTLVIRGFRVCFVCASGRTVVAGERSRMLDMQSLGLTPDDLNPSGGPLSSRRALARAQSAQIMAKKILQRDRIKQQMREEEERLKVEKREQQYRKSAKWQSKMGSSPFTVNLVADAERLEEEHSTRLEEEARRRAAVESRTRAAKEEIILRALQVWHIS